MCIACARWSRASTAITWPITPPWLSPLQVAKSLDLDDGYRLVINNGKAGAQKVDLQGQRGADEGTENEGDGLND